MFPLGFQVLIPAILFVCWSDFLYEFGLRLLLCLLLLLLMVPPSPKCCGCRFFRCLKGGILRGNSYNNNNNNNKKPLKNKEKPASKTILRSDSHSNLGMLGDIWGGWRNPEREKNHDGKILTQKGRFSNGIFRKVAIIHGIHHDSRWLQLKYLFIFTPN